MASRIEHRAEFDQGVAEVFAAHSEEPALRARLDAIGGENSVLLDHTADPDGARFTLRQGVGSDKLPSAIRALHKGDLFVDRTQTWERSGEGYTGTVNATVSGVPGEISARTELRAATGKAVLSTLGEVKIRIPLVGGKLEGFVADQITKLLQREAEFTAQWLAENS